MRKINCPSLNWELEIKKNLKNILKIKCWNNNLLFLSIFSKVKKTYKDYRKYRMVLENIIRSPSLINCEIDIMKSCYEGPTKPLKNLKQKLEEVFDLCPYCNMGEISTTDHYLPQAEFPQYTILYYNLIPSCAKCNNLKWIKWLEHGVRKILHIYFDDIPENEQFLHITLSITNDSILPHYYFEFDPTNYLNKVLENHLNTLDLFNRYAKSINNEISNFITSIIQNPTSDIVDLSFIKNRASYEYRVKIKGKSMNYWKAILYKEIAENEEICLFILNKVKNNFSDS